MKLVRQFFADLISGDPKVSSKRFIGLASFVALIMTMCRILWASGELHNQNLIQESMNMLVALITVTVLGGSVETIMKMRAPKPPADDPNKKPDEPFNPQIP
jgi:hypothetical protein